MYSFINLTIPNLRQKLFGFIKCLIFLQIRLLNFFKNFFFLSLQVDIEGIQMYKLKKIYILSTPLENALKKRNFIYLTVKIVAFLCT